MRLFKLAVLSIAAALLLGACASDGTYGYEDDARARQRPSHAH